MIHWHERDEYCEYANNLGVLVETESNEIISAVIKQDGVERRFFSIENDEMPEIHNVTYWVDEGDVASFLDKNHHKSVNDALHKLDELSHNIHGTDLTTVYDVMIILKAILNS